MRLLLVGATLVGAGATLVSTSAPTFRRSDGTAIRFAAPIRVWCGRWEPDVPVRSLHVGALPARRGSSYWMLTAVLRDVRAHPRVRFPIGFVWNRPKGAEIFVYDARTKNEASSETEEAHGTVEFSQVGCRRGQRVQLTVHGVLGSEFFDGKKVRSDGTVRGVVGATPAVIKRAGP